VGLVVVAVAALWLRRMFVLSFFVDGAPGAAPALTPAGAEEAALAPSDRVRVVLLDGLSAAHADRMPTLGALCRAGLDLRVDTGFPTVSLPVQHVLWTGRTQQQSGVLYRIPRLPAPPADALPRRVEGSVGVAESHADIVQSLGFAHAAPPADDATIDARGSAWRREGFPAAALAAVAGPAPLAFVHVLRIDEAGHAHGGASPAYAAAVAWADVLLWRLRAIADPTVTWVVLADHGHRPAGGHGGEEAAIRVVRACIAGPGIAAADHRTDAPIHLVDLHHALAELLAVAGPATPGRGLAFALAHPDPGATLPRPSGVRLTLAFAVVLVGFGAAVASAGLRLGAWPWWIAIAYASVVVLVDWPTLSNPVVYPRYAGAMLAAALPGALVLALASRRGLQRDGLRRTLVAQGVPLVALLLACLVACGALAPTAPPLVPFFTAHASLAFALVALGASVLAVVVLVPAARAGTRDR
jgi:Type I phosphodiesterase / nucleotide pyrophosphatase